MIAEQVFTTVLHFREIHTNLKWRLKATGARGESESPLVCFLINAHSKVNYRTVGIFVIV